MITLLLALFLGTIPAQADDILFLNLNNSPKEIEAAQRAARQSGRNLVVVPDVSKADQKAARKLKIAIAQGKKNRDRVCTEENSPACQKSSADLLSVETAQQTLLKKLYFDVDKLDTFLASRNGKPFTSVIISGHDGTGNFGGDFGVLGDEQLGETFSKYPEMKEGIRALHLWGCYTTSPGSIVLNWKKYFPRTALITGYDGRAPLNDKPAGWQYLEGVVARETALINAGDSAKLKKMLRVIPGAIWLSAGIYTCDNFATPTDHFSLEEFKERCVNYKTAVEQQSALYDCFLRANAPECADPPRDTGKSILRSFYELLQNASACVEFSLDPIYSTYSRDTAIRLVFNREIQNNFAKTYRETLEEVDAMLKNLGAPEDLRFANINSLSRQEMLERAGRLLNFLREQQPDPLADPKNIQVDEHAAQISSLQVFQRSLTNVMTNMDAKCVPFNWTEPNRSDKSACMPEEKMGFMAVADMLENENLARANIAGDLAFTLSDRMKIKGSGGDSAGIAAARNELLSAQLTKLRAYSSAKPDQDLLYRAALREKRANLLLRLSQADTPEALQNPSVVRLTLELNKNWLVRKNEEMKNQLEHYQAALPEQEPALRPQIEEYIKYLQTMIDGRKISLEITSQMLAAAVDGKLAQGTALEEAMAKYADHLRELTLAYARANADNSAKKLQQARENGWTPEALLEAQKKKESDALALQHAEIRNPAEWRAQAQAMLLTLRSSAAGGGGETQ